MPSSTAGRLKKNQLAMNVWIYFWTLSSIQFFFMSALMPASSILITLPLYQVLKLRSLSPPTLFFFEILPLAISYKYENQLIYSCKKVHWNFVPVYFGSIDHCAQVLMF